MGIKSQIKEEMYDREHLLRQATIREQQKLRENALQQAEALLEYKRNFCHHPSHQGSNNNNKNDPQQPQGGLFSIFVSLLAEPLSRTGNARSDIDHMTIELVLHLFRNLLMAEPLIGKDEQLHNELITLLEKELVLEILLVLAADIEQRENAPYNLLLMELIYYLTRHQDPVKIAQSVTEKGKETTGTMKSGKPANQSKSLLGKLKREKQSMLAAASSRHSQFGGTLALEKRDGRRQYVSVAAVGKQHLTKETARRRKNKQFEPFIGATTTHFSMSGSPTAQRAAQTLHRFCQRFVETCYGPVMKSLKNEFRRDSVRLEDGDRVLFFQIVRFFCQWWRAAGGTKREENSRSSIGHLIFTMDVFSFNLVLNATDTYTRHKKHMWLAHAVGLLSEMMHLLHVIYSSKETTEHIMALGLMDRLFYNNEPLDRLPKLFSAWKPGTLTREYLCDLVEVCHMTLKLLDLNAEACSVKQNPTQEGEMSKDDAKKHDTVEKMKAIAAEFDVSSYFARKIVSNHTVYMYTQLLAQYAINRPQENHRVVAFFLRLCKHKISLGGPDNNNQNQDNLLPKNPLAAKPVTLEPMLYNVHLIMVLQTILNDRNIRDDPEYAALLSLATNLVHHFAVAAQANPMLFSEALFKHPLPHRFCEFVTHMYVSDDLRMMVERDLLLQQQRKYEEEAARLRAEEGDESSDESDEELEFTDLPPTNSLTTKATVTEKSTSNHRSSDSQASGSRESEGETPKNRGDDEMRVLEDSSDDDDDDDDDDVDGATQKLRKLVKQSSAKSQALQKRLRELDSDESDEKENAMLRNQEDLVDTDDDEGDEKEAKPPRLDSQTKKPKIDLDSSDET
jgi:timeless